MVGLSFLLALFGCTAGSADVGTGPDPDARLISDIHTFGCRDGDYHFLGVGYEEISLEVAPDALEPMDLPAPGECVTGLDLFPSSAGPGGGNPDFLDTELVWTAPQSSGTIKRRSTGFWTSYKAGTQLTCIGSTSIGGIELVDAGAFSGVHTPSPPSDGNVQADGADDGIDFGEKLDVTFDATNWDDVWVQLRRERDTEAWETVTCDVTGQSSFTLGAEHWKLMDPDLAVDVNDLLVVFQSSRSVSVEGGATMETVTRTVTSTLDL